MAMMAITTSSSIKVKPFTNPDAARMEQTGFIFNTER